MTVCMSCGRDARDKATKFPCPSCGAVLVRCADCKARGNEYKCISCGNLGP
ncbi:DUF1610 domain-containing protein [Candidatus Micrarchaeota archaeon]|nr:DUF1610 domain-containing protein [Candidatus Micrarchaeota archaeon]